MSERSCGVRCTRVLLFLLNILFVICGFTLLGFGIFVQVSKKLDAALSEQINIKVLGGNTIEWVGVTMIVVAVITVLISAFGCLGAVFQRRVLLYLYAVILSLLIITELTAFIATLTSRVHIRDSYKSGFRELFIDSYRNNHTDLQQVIESVEREFECCGVDNVTDYYEHNFTVPATCHHDQDFDKPISDHGCADAVIQWIWKEFPIIGGVLCGILLIEIFGVIAAIALGIGISRSSYDIIYR